MSTENEKLDTVIEKLDKLTDSITRLADSLEKRESTEDRLPSGERLYHRVAPQQGDTNQ